MFGVTTSDDYKPVAWVGRFAIDATTLLVAGHVACMVLACFLIAFSGDAFLNWLQFDSAAVWNGAVHQLFTYAFVHPPSNLPWFAVEMYMLFAFGREVERFIGRTAFLTLYLILLLAPALVLTLWGLRQRTALADSGGIHFAIFIAFAAIYPNVQMFFLRITAKWIALIFAALYSLQLLAYHVWPQLAVLWLSLGAAFLFVRLRGIGPELVWWETLKMRLRPKPKFKVVPREPVARPPEPDDVYASIDPLLDKISKHGIASLTAGERRALDRARARLLKKSE
jgi:membrane associated rhomboid family serine protease